MDVSTFRMVLANIAFVVSAIHRNEERDFRRMTNQTQRRTNIMRIGLAVFLGCAVLAAASLLLEFARFSPTLWGHWDRGVVRLLVLVLLNLIFSSILAFIGLLTLWVRVSKNLPDLCGWHLQSPESEFCASDATPGYDFDDYLEQESRVYTELQALIAGPWSNQVMGGYTRYNALSVSSPLAIADRDWNRSWILESDLDRPKGGVLLLHGLSDSPYSLRALGQRLHAEGYTVLWLRLPGHGTCPAALAKVASNDWIAAVRVAMRGLRDRLPPETPLVLGGYSNGGALSVLYTLSAIDDSDLPQPSALILFAPMIGINPLAKWSRLYHTVALVSRNRKAQWSGVAAEIDPFRYSSWPMNASVEAWRVTQAVERKLAALQRAGRMQAMPPILALQSVVDSTIIVPKLITTLFDRLTSADSELLLFDINRLDKIENLFNRSFEGKIFPKLDRTDLPYTLRVVRNEHSESARVVMQTRQGKLWKELATELSWPRRVVSLSHLSVPIPPEDPIYGSDEATSAGGLPLGTLNLRAEPSALLIADSLFFRCRNNPFYHLAEDHAVQWLADRLAS